MNDAEKTSSMKFACLIPSYNEQETIGKLVRVVRQKDLDCLVVDDGSVDDTARLARDNGAEVVMNQVNLGKGASLRKGFEILKNRDYAAVIVMDADGQHLSEDVDSFLHRYEKTRAGIVVGNRMHRPEGMPVIRWMTNVFMSWLISAICRQRIPDTQCGFRLVSMEALRALDLKTDRFEIESEMLIEAARAGFRIESVSITTVYEGQTSAIHPWKDTVRFFRFVLRRR